MSCAELLRRHADEATRGDGICFSGEYMAKLASEAEGIEAENAKMRVLVREMYSLCCAFATCGAPADVSWLADRMREAGIEV